MITWKIKLTPKNYEASLCHVFQTSAMAVTLTFFVLRTRKSFMKSLTLQMYLLPALNQELWVPWPVQFGVSTLRPFAFKERSYLKWTYIKCYEKRFLLVFRKTFAYVLNEWPLIIIKPDFPWHKMTIFIKIFLGWVNYCLVKLITIPVRSGLDVVVFYIFLQ